MAFQKLIKSDHIFMTMVSVFNNNKMTIGDQYNKIDQSDTECKFYHSFKNIDPSLHNSRLDYKASFLFGGLCPLTS